MDILTSTLSLLSWPVTIFNFYSAIGDTVYNLFVQYSRTILDALHLFFDSAFYVFLFLTVGLTLIFSLVAIILFFVKEKRAEKIHLSRFPFVTIQIPTYNELAALNCAEHCLLFDYPKNSYEIIIGDDSTDSEVSKQIDNFASKHKDNVKVTRRGKNIGFKPGNLNHMLSYSNGKYIVIFDSDFLPKSDFLKRIIQPLEADQNVSAVQARWVTKNFSKNTTAVLGGTIPLLTHHLGLSFLNLIGSNGFIAGSAEAIRTKDLKNLGGWKSGCLTEDIEYSLRLTSRGKKIIYLDSLLCECEAPFTPNDLYRQQMRWAYGVISSIKLHFVSIMTNYRLGIKWKANMLLLLAGYLATIFFFLLTVFGSLSIITHRPETIIWMEFLTKTFFNIAITSGFILTFCLTLINAKKANEIPRMLAASYTIGVVLILVVTFGISKAVFNRPMSWFMLSKDGNTVKS
ncbi:MAG: glycosyltransferase [Nanoarchaeota archaeon]